MRIFSINTAKGEYIMILFSWLNKQEKALWLPKLFDLLYDNMSVIAPSGLTYEQVKNNGLQT